MSNALRNHRVSVIVPLEREHQLFEDTLLSVLENADDDCEIVAVHNGSYEDPFELAGELALVTARSSNLVDQVRDAFDSTTAPLVQILTSGTKVHPQWLDSAIESFDEDTVGAIVPQQQRDRRRGNAAGWNDTSARLCQPVDTQTGSIDGFFLGGVVIRRHLLKDLLEAVAPAMNHPIAVAYAFGGLLRRSGWSIRVAKGFEVDCSQSVTFEDASDFDRGQLLGSIQAHLFSSNHVPSLGSSMMTAVFGESSVGEALGMAKHRNRLAATRRAIDVACVATPDEVARRTRIQSVPVEAPFRRAA